MNTINQQFDVETYVLMEKAAKQAGKKFGRRMAGFSFDRKGRAYLILSSRVGHTLDNKPTTTRGGKKTMEDVKQLERRISRLEKRINEVKAHARALEKVVKNVIGDATKSAFEFAVSQYGWQELHEMNERVVREDLKGKDD